MYVAYWIEKKQSESQKAKATLENALSRLAQETAQAEKDSADALGRLGDLEKDCNQINTTIIEVQNKRTDLMKKLKENAETQVRFEKFLRASGEVLGAVMQLAPVAQPALGAFGK